MSAVGAQGVHVDPAPPALAHEELAIRRDAQRRRRERPTRPLRPSDPLAEQPVGVKHRDVVAGLLQHVQAVGAIGRDPYWTIESDVAVSVIRTKPTSVPAEYVDQAVLGIADVGATRPTHRDVRGSPGPRGPRRLPVFGRIGPGRYGRRDRPLGTGPVDAQRTPDRAQGEALEREDLDPPIAGVGDVEVIARRDGDPKGPSKAVRRVAVSADTRDRVRLVSRRIDAAHALSHGVHEVQASRAIERERAGGEDVFGHAGAGAGSTGQRSQAQPSFGVRAHRAIERCVSPARSRVEQEVPLARLRNDHRRAR